MVIGTYELLPGNGQMKNALPLAQALGVFTFEEPKRIEEDESLGMPKLVVRNTFLDLEDSEMDRKEDSDRGAQRIRVIFNMDKQMRHCGIWFHTLLVSLSFGYWPCSLYDDSIWCIKFSNSPGKEEDTQDPADRPKRRTRSAKRFPVELSVAEFA